MKKDYLNHFLDDKDGYGQYETIIASQVGAAGTKKLIMVTEIRGANYTTSHFRVLHNNVIVDCSTDLEAAKDAYNKIQ